MRYQVLVLDLDGTLTNSKKEISKPTLNALMEIQQAGKIVVLASGRPIRGVVPLADKLELEKYGGYMLSFNGARITQCSTGRLIYNRTVPNEVIRPICEAVIGLDGVNIISYSETEIFSAKEPGKYTILESRINDMNVVVTDDLPGVLPGSVNKLLLPGEPEILEKLMPKLKEQYHGLLSIYRSEPFFLEIMPRNIDKANSLQKLLNSLGMTADQMICCGDGYNDVSMIEYAGLGVAMGNAQPAVKDSADFVTRTNDEDGILHVIDLFMRD